MADVLEVAAGQWADWPCQKATGQVQWAAWQASKALWPLSPLPLREAALTWRWRA